MYGYSYNPYLYASSINNTLPAWAQELDFDFDRYYQLTTPAAEQRNAVLDAMAPNRIQMQPASTSPSQQWKIIPARTPTEELPDRYSLMPRSGEGENYFLHSGLPTRSDTGPGVRLGKEFGSCDRWFQFISQPGTPLYFMMRPNCYNATLDSNGKPDGRVYLFDGLDPNPFRLWKLC